MNRAGLAVLAALAGLCAFAQTPVRLDWRRIGNNLIMRGLASPASGPAERVWFDPSGERLFVRVAGGRTFASTDFEHWTRVGRGQDAPPAEMQVESLSRPAAAVGFRAQRRRSATVYAFGGDAWRSDNEGQTWNNLTSWKGQSLLGGTVLDLAVSPRNEKEIAAATWAGVWMSHDGGLSWHGVNEGLPNFPGVRIVSAPAGGQGLQVVAAQSAEVLAWNPGQKQGWTPAGDAAFYLDGERRLANSLAVKPAGRIVRIWQSTSDSRTLATASLVDTSYRVYRSVNGGNSWDDITSNLPPARINGITGDVNSSVIYAATDAGLFYARTDLRAPVPPPTWFPVQGLPEGVILDTRLDTDANQLYVAVEGIGVFGALAPHRAWSPAVVHSADYGTRGIAPGALVSILGVNVKTAAAGAWSAPVLSATPAESQIQVPFEVQGDRVALTLGSGSEPLRFDVPLRASSPAILVDREGSAMILDGDSGIQVDALNPARGGARIQILATGLGRVTPDWPTGLPAPMDGAPRVVAPVRVLLDGAPVNVSRAVLAPGYIGYYLVEIALPDFVNRGVSELVIESAGRASNRVRIYLDR